MKLYTFDPAPNARRLSAFMSYKGIKIPTEQVDLITNEQLSDEYRAINPQATIPALVLDDGAVLTEGVAICVYLESLYPENPLLGTNASERGQIINWMHILFHSFLLPTAEVLRNSGDVFHNRAWPGPLDLQQIPALVERGHLRIEGFLQQLNQSLEGREYLVGDRLTQADIDGTVIVEFQRWVKRDIPTDHTHIVNWHNRVKSELD
jgi:glutathione S-transferase